MNARMPLAWPTSKAAHTYNVLHHLAGRLLLRPSYSRTLQRHTRLYCGLGHFSLSSGCTGSKTVTDESLASHRLQEGTRCYRRHCFLSVISVIRRAPARFCLYNAYNKGSQSNLLGTSHASISIALSLAFCTFIQCHRKGSSVRSGSYSAFVLA